MHLKRLHVERIRNLETVAMKDLRPFTVLYGENGSGKTSILESIHILATGRSFRTHMAKHYIMHDAPDAIVFAEAVNDKIGIQKFVSGEQTIKINGDPIATQGQLALMLPVQYLDPLSTDIIDHGSKPRRQLLDWLMFHVEPDFYFTWQHYSRALKQRNALLKSKKQITLNQIEPWNNLLAQYGELLHVQRSQVIEQWREFFNIEIHALLPDVVIHMEYYAGFQTQHHLLDIFIEQHTKDCDRRYTEYGPHRADIKLKTMHGLADVVLSRGQKKLLITALKLSQIAMLHASDKETVVLLDDLTAELDLSAQQRVLGRLHELGSQVFLTTLDQVAVEKHLYNLGISYQLFNVHRGMVYLTRETNPTE